MALTAGMVIGSLCFEPIYRATSSVQSIHGIINNIYEYGNCVGIINSIKKLDIEASIRVLEKMFKELTIKNKTKTLEESILLLKKSITDIENELAIIHEQLAYNKSLKYFTWFRSYKFTSSIAKLEELKSQLDNRVKMLFLILNNSNSLTINDKNDTDLSLMD